MPLYRAGGTWMSCTCVCKLQDWSWIDQPTSHDQDTHEYLDALAWAYGTERCCFELANSTTLRGLQVLPRCFERWQVRPHRDPITVGELLKSIKGRAWYSTSYSTICLASLRCWYPASDNPHSTIQYIPGLPGY
ncbi:hypothetical protein TWF217_000956 [Orbilia oligospora]|nr:hypothetical protein TWF751_004452 [Orbilia oligospora]KAF3266866.1 hypothetical protein TWF217_000956 [Orbilia oligospora]KAF3297279.1 hypothetical protein TWF132_007382 [Orbilia oligospora]